MSTQHTLWPTRHYHKSQMTLTFEWLCIFTSRGKGGKKKRKKVILENSFFLFHSACSDFRVSLSWCQVQEKETYPLPSVFSWMIFFPFLQYVVSWCCMFKTCQSPIQNIANEIQKHGFYSTLMITYLPDFAQLKSWLE